MKLASIKELYRVTSFTCTPNNRPSLLKKKFLTQSNCSSRGSNQAFLLWEIRLRSNLHLGEAKGGFLVDPQTVKQCKAEASPSSPLAISSAPIWKLLLGKMQLSS